MMRYGTDDPAYGRNTDGNLADTAANSCQHWTEGIYLTGGSTRIPNIDKFLSHKLEHSVQLSLYYDLCTVCGFKGTGNTSGAAPLRISCSKIINKLPDMKGYKDEE